MGVRRLTFLARRGIIKKEKGRSRLTVIPLKLMGQESDRSLAGGRSFSIAENLPEQTGERYEHGRELKQQRVCIHSTTSPRYFVGWWE